MSRWISMRYWFATLFAVTLLPCPGFAQSQNSQSVAEAARRAKQQKKTPAKPEKVYTEDDVKPATPAGAPAAPTAGSNATAPTAAGTPTPTAAQAATANRATEPLKEGENAKEPKEVTALKEQVKQAAADLDLLQRELRLDMDALYSKPDYSGDKDGIAKVDGEKQQVSDKKQELEGLKAKLAEMLQSLGITDIQAPPKP